MSEVLNNIDCQRYQNRPNVDCRSLLSVLKESIAFSETRIDTILVYWLDKVLAMGKQINNMCKSALNHQRKIAKIRKFISFKHCEMLMHAFISSQLDLLSPTVIRP